jgi:hypothetical protein
MIDFGGYPGPLYGYDTISYPTDQPTITGVLGCTNSATVNSTSGCTTKGGSIITVIGHNFQVPVAVLVSGDACAPVVWISSEQVQCPVPSGVGLEQSVVVNSANQFSAPAKLLSYAAPSITNVIGCDTSSSLSTTNCDRNGSTILTILGRDFGPSGATILIGSVLCNNIIHDPITPHNKLTCRLPSGNREDRSLVVVQRNGAVSQTPAFVSYFQCPAGIFIILSTTATLLMSVVNG